VDREPVRPDHSASTATSRQEGGAILRTSRPPLLGSRDAVSPPSWRRPPPSDHGVIQPLCVLAVWSSGEVLGSRTRRDAPDQFEGTRPQQAYQDCPPPTHGRTLCDRRRRRSPVRQRRRPPDIDDRRCSGVSGSLSSRRPAHNPLAVPRSSTSCRGARGSVGVQAPLGSERCAEVRRAAQAPEQAQQLQYSRRRSSIRNP
jgi:hypothetical protein